MAEHRVYVISEVTPATTMRHVDEHLWVCTCGETSRGSDTDRCIIRNGAIAHARDAD